MMTGDQNRSVSIAGSVTGSAIVTGDRNTVSVQWQQATLPEAATVDMAAELVALREVLLSLETPDRGKIERALADAEEEAQKPEPDKDEVGQALDRAITYATKANGFAEAVEKLTPHVQRAAAWLGENWFKILAAVGLAAM